MNFKAKQLWSSSLPILVTFFLLSVFVNRASTNLWTRAKLSQPRYLLATATVGTKAIFAGGDAGRNGGTTTVDIYDGFTNSWTTANLSMARNSLAGAAAGDKALFGGGFTSGIGTDKNRVDIYDSANDRWTTANLSHARWALAAASSGQKAVFGGGTGQWSNVVDIYDSASNSWSTAQLSRGRSNLAATTSSDGSLIFFAGGLENGKFSDAVDIYSVADNSWSTAKLSQKRTDVAAAAAGTKVIFAGGYNNSLFQPGRLTDVVDIYDTVTKKWAVAHLSEARGDIAAASAGGKIFFAGGSGFGYSDNVDIFDTATNLWTLAKLSEGRTDAVATTLGTKVFFAAGMNSHGLSSAVDICDTSFDAAIASD